MTMWGNVRPSAGWVGNLPNEARFCLSGAGVPSGRHGRDLASAFSAARYLFAEVDEALSQRLSQLMFEGPESDLILTENAQPALLAASLAVVRVLEEEGGPRVRPAMLPTWPDTPSANIRRWRRRALSRSAPPRASSNCGDR